jgi:hypothetical protein
MKPINPKAVQEAFMAEWDRRGNKDLVKVKGEVFVAKRNNNRNNTNSNNNNNCQKREWKPRKPYDKSKYCDNHKDCQM